MKYEWVHDESVSVMFGLHHHFALVIDGLIAVNDTNTSREKKYDHDNFIKNELI